MVNQNINLDNYKFHLREQVRIGVGDRIYEQTANQQLWRVWWSIKAQLRSDFEQ